jgi:hypothetical protein
LTAVESGAGASVAGCGGSHRRRSVAPGDERGCTVSCERRRLPQDAPAPLAREGDQEIMPAVRASGPGETLGEDAALEVTTKFPFDIGRHALRVPVVFTPECEIGLQVLLDDLVEGGLLGMAAAVRGRSASL